MSDIRNLFEGINEKEIYGITKKIICEVNELEILSERDSKLADAVNKATCDAILGLYSKAAKRIYDGLSEEQILNAYKKAVKEAAEYPLIIEQGVIYGLLKEVRGVKETSTSN